MMKRKLAAILLAIAITFITIILPGGTSQSALAAGNQNWAFVGAPNFSGDRGTDVALYIDDGTLYVAYIDMSTEKITVKRYENGSWQTVGQAGFTGKAFIGGYENVSLYVNAGIPYVAYSDMDNSCEITIMKYDAGWQQVGSTLGQGLYPSLGFFENKPYVAYSDYSTTPSGTSVQKFDNGSWNYVGSAGFSHEVSQSPHYTKLCISGGELYVAFTDVLEGRPYVMKYNNSSDSWDVSWEYSGDPYKNYTTDDVFISSDGTDVYFGHYHREGRETLVYKKVTSGIIWARITENIQTDINGLCVYDSIPYVIASDTVCYYSGMWDRLTFDKFSGHQYSIAMHDGIPYVATASNSGVSVVRLNTVPSNVNLDNNTVLENEPAGTVVGTLTTEDTDIHDNHTYSLVSGTGDADNSSFTIDGNILKTADTFDFETKSIYHIRVQAIDGGGDPVERAFTINVLDVEGDANDNEIVVDFGPIIPEGAVGSAYSYVPTIVKGTAPYTWSATGFPAGLDIDDATGEISGTPSAVGTSALSVTVTDSMNASLTMDFDITIGHAELCIDTPNLLAATLGESYSCTLSASGGDSCNSWYTSGLPDGLSIGRDDGVITGTPGKTGTFQVEVRVYDGERRKATKTYSLTVSSPSATGKYEVLPDVDSAYTVSEVDGFTTLTIKNGVSGFRYINAQINKVVSNEGEETVVFVLLRNDVQIGFSITKADFDIAEKAGAGFNVQAGDIIKIYVVDELSNSANSNPILLQ